MEKCNCGHSHCCHEETITEKVIHKDRNGNKLFIDGKPFVFLRKKCAQHNCNAWIGDIFRE